MTSNEKVGRIFRQAWPALSEYVDSSPAGAMVLAFLGPQLGELDAFLDSLPSELLDEILACVIDLAGRLRSDRAGTVVADENGANIWPADLARGGPRPPEWPQSGIWPGLLAALQRPGGNPRDDG